MKLAIPLIATTFAITALAVPIHTEQTIAFGDCSEGLGPQSLKCGYLDVPMDWNEPSDSRIVRIGLVKIPARRPEKRIGPLFYNPGGPGAAASGVLAKIATNQFRIHDEILDRFDIIGVDLRGTGLSSPITCSSELYNQTQTTFYPSTADAFERLVKQNQAFRKSCLDMTGSDLIDYMDTISIVHDHEAVRRALGGEKLTWLGQSYGTQLGSQYAELYAENIRAMVLDSVVFLSQAETALFVESGASEDAAMGRFFAWCEQSNATICPAAHLNTTRTLSETWQDLLLKAEQSPIPAPRCASGIYDCVTTAATSLDLRNAALALLDSQTVGFTMLAGGIYQAVVRNDASTLLSYVPQLEKGANAYNASQDYGNVAITCQDWRHASSATEMEWWKQIATIDMPNLLGLTPEAGVVHQCVGWPAPKRNPPHRIDVPGTLQTNILLVTNLYDSRTPLAMAVQLQQEIRLDRAVLVARNAVGHSVYHQPDAFDGPTVKAMDRYLLTGETPEQGTVFDN